MIDLRRNRVFHRFFLPAVFTAGLLLVANCAGMGRKPLPPRIQIADIQVQEVKALETAFQVQLRLINPNDFPLDVKGLSCDMEIDGKRFAAGVSNTHRQIPAYGSDTIEVSVYSSAINMAAALIQMLKKAQKTGAASEKLVYRLSGRLNLGGLAAPVPFSSEGALSLDDLAPR